MARNLLHSTIISLYSHTSHFNGFSRIARKWLIHRPYGTQCRRDTLQEITSPSKLVTSDMQVTSLEGLVSCCFSLASRSATQSSCQLQGYLAHKKPHSFLEGFYLKAKARIWP